MLTTKIRAQVFLILFFGWTLISGVTGCAPAGARALSKGEKLIEQGKYSEAVKYFEEATKAFPDHAKAWNHLGLGYQYAGATKKSVQAYQQALKLDQNLTAARYNLGSLYLDENNYLAALSELTTFVQLEPKSADGWHKLGVTQMQMASRSSGGEKNRQLEAAKKSLDYAQSLQPSAETLNTIGLLQIQRGNSREAISSFTAALQEQSDYTPAMLNLAVVYHQYLGDKRQALANYQKFLETAKQAPEAAQVQATVRQLELELNPQVAAVTPAPTVSKPAPVQNATIPTQTTPEKIGAKPEPTVAKAPSKPAPVLASPKAQTQQPSPKREPPVEVTTLPDEPPPIKTAEDIAFTNVPKPGAPTTNRAIASVTPPREIDGIAKTPDGRTSKLNPVSWFRKKPKITPSVTELPTVKPTLTTNTVASASVQKPAAPVRSNPLIPRYRYRSPAKPREGNRVEAEPLFARGVQAQKDGRLADALEAYRQALQKNPLYFEATYNLALAARAAGDLSASLTAYEQSLVIMPESVNARYNFAFTLQEAGYFQDSADELKKLLRQNPNETRGHLLLASLCAQRLDEVSTARTHYKSVLELEPQHPQATQIRYWLAAHP